LARALADHGGTVKACERRGRAIPVDRARPGGAGGGRGKEGGVMAKQSPTSRALALYRELGFKIEKVEQRLPIPGKYVTRDLFNCIDLVAVKPGVGVVGIQATSGANHAARVAKAKAEECLRVWIESGGRFEVVSFSAKCSDGRGSRKVITPRREELRIEDLTTA
jgi:hypothetical protein